MTILLDAILGLQSPDPIKFDNSYDVLLFEDQSSVNTFLIDSIRENQQTSSLSKFLMQIVTFRATQTKQNRWIHRFQGTLSFADFAGVLFEALSDVHSDVRMEAIHCLSDLCEHNLKDEQLTQLLTEYNTAIYPLRHPQFVEYTLEMLNQTARADMDVNVQLLAENTAEKIVSQYNTLSQKERYIDTTQYTEFEFAL